jgi:hypothetical protein
MARANGGLMGQDPSYGLLTNQTNAEAAALQ